MRFLVRATWPVLVGLILLSACSAVTLLASDWASWRGPEQNGVSRETDLPAKWSDDLKDPTSNLIWKAPYGCRSTPIIMDGRAYINNQVGEGINEQERVMCFDADTGKLLWEKRFNVFHTDIVSVRLGWTVLCGDPKTGHVYWHGTQGQMVCFDRDGKILWERSLTEEYGRISGYGGRVTSPIIDEDLVIIGMLNSAWGAYGKGANRFIAFNKNDGRVIWWSELPGQPRNTYYSVPVVAVINGQRLLITGSGNGGIHAIKARTGEYVWSYFIGLEDVNVSPVVAGKYVYCGHGNDNVGDNTQGCLICLDAGEVKDHQPKEVWRINGLRLRYTSPVLHEGKLYVADDVAKLYCIDALTGKQQWKYSYGRNARGSPVWADGKIYITDVNSKFHILKPEEKKCVKLHTHLFEGKNGIDVEVNGTPAVSHGRVYFATSDEFYCIGKKNWKGKAAAIPSLPPETPVGEPAGIRLDPADVVLHPGQSAEFKVVVYDGNGRELKKAATPTGEWSLPLPTPPPGSKLKPPALKGTLTSGKLMVDPKVPNQGGTVQFSTKLGKATARVRVAPTLPYAIDFEKLPDGAVPGGWVNTGGKFFVTTLKDGNKVLRNQNTKASPLLSRANAYLALPELKGYTIEADVMGTKVQTGTTINLPDMGVVNARYTLELLGNLQQVRITSWDAIPRVAATEGYKVEPDTWYRFQLRVQTEGKTARLLGKVWPKAQQEPQAWTIDFVDPTPNYEGSPALYSYGKGIQEDQPGTIVYFDNVRVYMNKAK